MTAVTALLVASVCFTSLLGTLLGYDIGIISGAIVFLTKDLSLSTGQAEVVVGSLNLVSAFGALLVGSFADRFGRRAAICLANAWPSFAEMSPWSIDERRLRNCCRITADATLLTLIAWISSTST